MAHQAAGRVVVVSGAARGIGRACVRELERAGFDVFAGVRSDADARALLDAAPRVTPLRLDVTDPDQVAAAAAAVGAATGDRGVHGLVNNAGIAVPGPLEFLPLDAFRQQLDVNVTGTLALTQALLPQLRRARGRVVTLGSVNGRVASAFNGAYAASKFALEALSDALRRELAHAGVDVVLIQPGAFRTDIWDGARERAVRLATGFPDAAWRYYGRVLERLETVRAPRRAGDPARVARVVVRALRARRPRARYAVGMDARLGILLAALLPDRWLDAVLAGPGAGPRTPARPG